MRAHAKVNLFLKILNRRSDGLHELASRFVILRQLFDEVFIIQRKIAVELDGMGFYEALAIARGLEGQLPSDGFSEQLVQFCNQAPAKSENILSNKMCLCNGLLANFYAPKNICDEVLAHLSVSEAAWREEFVVAVFKSVPIFSGLGGASSNAAALLLLLQERMELAGQADEIAPQIGADVAFFTSKSECANVRGFGQIIEPVSDLAPKLELKFTRPCSTALVFAEFAKSPEYVTDASCLLASSNEQLRHLDPLAANDLLPAVLRIYPNLRDWPQDGYFLSGSGGTFFKFCEEK